VRVADFTAAGESVGDVSATAEWNLHTLTVSSARLAGFGGDAEASGTLGMQAPFPYRAETRWTALDLQRLAHLGPQVIKPSATSGQATLSGTLEPVVVFAEGGGSLAAAQGGDAIEWHGQGRYRDGAGDGEVEATQTPANRVHASVGVGAGGALRGTVDAAIASPTALGAFLPIESLPNLSGALNTTVEVSGTLDDPRASGQLSGRDLAVLGLSIEQLRGDFSVDRAALRTPGIIAALWQGSIALNGTLALDAAAENDWQLTAVDVPGDAVVGLVFAVTGSVPPIGRGTVAAELSGRGRWQQVAVNGHASMVNFWLSREWIQQAELAGSATWPQWQLEAELRNRAGQTLALRGRGTATDNVSITAQCSGWDLTALQRGELTEMGGSLMLEASLNGPLRALSGNAALRAQNLVLYGRHVGTIDLNVDATRGRWQLSASALDDALRVRAGLAPDAGWPFTLDGEWSNLHFGHLLVPDTDVHAESSGTLQCRGRLAALEQSEATVRVQTLRLANGPYELSAPQPMQAECRRGACTFEGIELRGPDTDLRASGSLAIGGAARVAITGQGDLRLLELAGGAIESARGRFTVDAELRRAGGAWDVSGELRFDQAALDVGAPVAITRTSGRLRLTGTTVQIDQLEGRIGTGTFAVGGALDLMRGPRVNWTLSDVGAELMPSLEVELSGRGGLDGTWEHMRVSGAIDVARMLYDRDISLTDFLPSLNRALAAAPRPPSQRQIDLDLHIVAPGELYVENNVARIEARADLTVTGTVEHPLLQGRIEVLDGTVTFRDRTFELQGGTVDFRPDLGLTAALNITAESTIDTPEATYLVDVRITGTTSEPRVIMSSDDPSLSPTDIATLIAVGKTTAQLREGGGGFSIDALALIPNQVSSPIAQGTKQLLPIDRFSIESTFSRSTGTFEPQLKLGKDLTDDLSVSVGQTFGVESRSSVEANYRLSPRISVLGTWESQTSAQEGAFGAGVRVRYEFWRVTPFTLLGGLP
jgi:autotransporter translocation and assembly factor TamB